MWICGCAFRNLRNVYAGMLNVIKNDPRDVRAVAVFIMEVLRIHLNPIASFNLCFVLQCIWMVHVKTCIQDCNLYFGDMKRLIWDKLLVHVSKMVTPCQVLLTPMKILACCDDVKHEVAV